MSLYYTGNGRLPVQVNSKVNSNDVNPTNAISTSQLNNCIATALSHS